MQQQINCNEDACEKRSITIQFINPDLKTKKLKVVWDTERRKAFHCFEVRKIREELVGVQIIRRNHNLTDCPPECLKNERKPKEWEPQKLATNSRNQNINDKIESEAAVR